MAKLPESQRCQFLIGPVSSWFMPDTADIWTQPKRNILNNHDGNDIMDCDISNVCDDTKNLSYFIYGSIGCFCYGNIYYNSSKNNSNIDYIISQQQQKHQQNSTKAVVASSVNRLIDIKEDNSRVACVRFLKTSLWPLVMILTESGSFIIHDCLSSKNLIHFRKAELINKFVDPLGYVETTSTNEHCKKKAKFNVTQQINSCLWPNAKNAFLGISLLKEKTNLLFWLKLKDLTKIQDQAITKNDLIESFERLELNLNQYSTPICCMECSMIDDKFCLISMATDDGLITIVSVNFEQGQTKRIIKLPRHNDQICSMSFYTGDVTKFPLGLLASVSRDGLTLIWDIENEFNFADYQAASDSSGKSNSKINWFALSFISSSIDIKHLNLALSNLDSGITLLEVPANARSKIRLKGKKQVSGNQNNQTIRHNALLFNISYNPINEILMTSSLDGNHLFWNCCKPTSENNTNKNNLDLSIEVKPQYLYPSMPNNSRTHMLRFNPIKEDLLGMAIGKAGLRFYQVSANPLNSRFDMSLSSALITRRVTKANLSPTSIAWHPSNEYRIAIGTLEGKVLRADLTPRKATLVEAEHRQIVRSRIDPTTIAKPVVYQNDDIFGVEYKPLDRLNQINENIVINKTTTPNCQQQKNQSVKTDGVYSMCWGPNPTCTQDLSRLAIYAIGSVSNRLFIYHKREKTSEKLTNFLDDFYDESLPEAIGEASEVAWKSSMDLMALGTTHGKIIIVSYKSEQQGNMLFNRLAVLQGPFGNKFIQCLSWHPTTDKEDESYYYIATSSNESPAFIFNIKENILVEEVRDRLSISEDKGNSSSSDIGHTDDNKFQYIPNRASNIISNYVYKLDAHKKAISDIAWNPHKSDELATSSFDRHCHVWSLKKFSNASSNQESDNNNSTDKQVNEEGSEMIKTSNEDSCLKATISSTFVARDRLFTLEWSFVDDDLIFTSGHDSIVWAWRPSENSFVRS